MLLFAFTAMLGANGAVQEDPRAEIARDIRACPPSIRALGGAIIAGARNAAG